MAQPDAGTGGLTLALLALTSRALKVRSAPPSQRCRRYRGPLRGLFGPNVTYVTFTLGAAAFLILASVTFW